MIWIVATVAIALGALWILRAWLRGLTIPELVRQPPQEVDLPQFVTILGYLHHELIKHRLPLVRTVAERPLNEVQPGDVKLLKQVLTGHGGRPSVVDELDGYLSGLRRAAGSVHLNFWRDPLIRRTRGACRMIQDVANGLGDRVELTHAEHTKLRKADRILDEWFKPRLQALRNSVLILKLSPELLSEPVNRVSQELGLDLVDVEYPDLSEPIQVRMLGHDFDLVLRNLIRNAFKASGDQHRIAIEIATRLELTGEESILVRIYDNDPNILSRKELYGGNLGRGLNLVTTTLRRYNASLRCARSKREGFAKFMEVRLFRELADETETALLDETDRTGAMVPALAGLMVLVAVSGLVASVGGWLPDPFAPQPPIADRDAGAATPDVSALPVSDKALFAAHRQASESLFNAIGHGVNATAKVPGPDDLSVDPRRCAMRRSKAGRRLELDCRLINLDYRLEPPVLILSTTSPYNFVPLEIEVHEDVVEMDNSTRPPKKGETCVKVTPVAPGANLPSSVILTLGPKGKHKGKSSRLVVDYDACLEKPRYPLEIRLSLKRFEAPPTEVNIKIKLRNAREARDAYSRIANQLDYIEDGYKRRALVTHIARYTAARLEHDFYADAMRDSSQIDLAQALYHGWIRPAIHELVEQRVHVASKKRKANARFCATHNDIKYGYERLAKLDVDNVSVDLYRSEYYVHQSLLWQFNDISTALLKLDHFQRTRGRQTDFVQGARFYAALLLALRTPPEAPSAAAGAIGSPEEDGEDETQRNLRGLVRLLSALLRDARNPPQRSSEYDYARVKLFGVKTVLREPRLEDGFAVVDLVCGFYEVHRPWVDAMSAKDSSRLFGHCPRFVPARKPSSLLDDDENEDEPKMNDLTKIWDTSTSNNVPDTKEEPEEEPKEENKEENEEEEPPTPRKRLTLAVQQSSHYIDSVTAMFRSGGPLCRKKP